MTKKDSQPVEPEEQGVMDVQEIEEAHGTIESQLHELEELVKKYQSRALGAKERGDPETLSNTLIRLARVNSALGGKAAYAKYVARNADRVYRRYRESQKLRHIELGMAIGKAESAGYVEADEHFKIYSDVQYLADKADDMAYKTDTFMKMAQSGLSLIKNDIKGSV